ncbi:MAG: NAD-dependent epimerase/dehydratase family protein [Candidatus Staskawiczbacteria bacterium]|nr:NAD-dependent epimerase/dehydratase family protein [Candidatus Staskawiczbacteria bacterium]
METANEKKTYLVTGGAGFVGSHMCEKLIAMGHQVICFDNLSTGKLENLSALSNNPHFTFIKGDANKLSDIEPVFKDHQLNGVFHYAAVVGVKRTIENPLMVLEDVNGIKNVLELALANGKPKVVFSSSSEVYGDPIELPEKEDGAVNPKIPYAVVKLMGEQLLEAYWKKYGLKTCALRFFNIYGPRQEGSDYGFVVGIFIKQVLAGKCPTVFGDGSQTRDFVYIEDNIEASVRAMELDSSNGQVINIGTGRPLTIYDLANKVIDCAGKKGLLQPELVPTNRIDVKHRFPEVGKMIRILNYHPAVSLEEGLKKILSFYVKR